MEVISFLNFEYSNIFLFAGMIYKLYRKFELKEDDVVFFNYTLVEWIGAFGIVALGIFGNIVMTLAMKYIP